MQYQKNLEKLKTKDFIEINEWKQHLSLKQALERVQSDCQFFPYKTNFNSLGEVLQMSKEREEGKGKPWYIGW